MDQKNCFDEVRFILAIIVLMAHTSILASTNELNWFTQYFDSDFAVKGFFAISGYLVTKSYYSSRGLPHFFEKRIRRIYPAYMLVIAYCLIVGLLTSPLSLLAFITHDDSIKYLIANLALANFIQPTLPDALIGNEMQVLNGSLWTIKVEVMLYCVVPIICLLYSKFGKIKTFLLFFLIGALWFFYFTEMFDHPLGPVIGRQFIGQLPYFIFGSILGFLTLSKRQYLTLSALAITAFIIHKILLTGLTADMAKMIIYPVLVIAIANSAALSIGLGRLGDLSYGLYLFHFPTIQWLEYVGLYQWNAYIGLIAGLLISLSLAFISWHLVEKRWLRRSSSDLNRQG